MWFWVLFIYMYFLCLWLFNDAVSIHTKVRTILENLLSIQMPEREASSGKMVRE